MNKNIIKEIRIDWNAEMLSNILSTATYGSDWLAVTVSEESRYLVDEMKKAEPEHDWCREDVFAGVLLKGGSLYMIDLYADDDDEHYEETLGGVPHRVSLPDFDRGAIAYANSGNFVSLAQVIEQDGQDDYFDDNNFIQCVMFGELVYG